MCLGVPVNGSNHTCTAGAGSLVLEFGLLSRLVGDPTFEMRARKAVKVLWDRRHPVTGLVGMPKNVQMNGDNNYGVKSRPYANYR